MQGPATLAGVNRADRKRAGERASRRANYTASAAPPASFLLVAVRGDGGRFVGIERWTPLAAAAAAVVGRARMTNVVDFPAGGKTRPPPDAIGVDFDFGAWHLVFYRGGKFAFRQGDYPCRADADADADAIAGHRAIKRVHPDRGGFVFVAPSEQDGGSWSLWHQQGNPSRRREVGNYFSMGEAFAAARSYADAHDAEFDE